jgi:hypothetical protein
MNIIRAPRFLLLVSLAGLAVFGGPPLAAIAAGNKADIDLMTVYSEGVGKGTRETLEAHIKQGAGGRKVAIHERDKMKNPSRRATPVSEDGAKVEHFILFVTAIDKNGDHKADHYDLKLDEDSDGDGNADDGPDFYGEGADNEAGLLADIDAMDEKLVALLVSRGE